MREGGGIPVDCVQSNFSSLLVYQKRYWADTVTAYCLSLFYADDINVSPKQHHLLLKLLMGDLIVVSPPIL